MKRYLIVLIGLLSLCSCVRISNLIDQIDGGVVVVFEDCPIQTSTHKFGGSISQTNYSTIAFIGDNGRLVEFEPRLFGRDTIIIPTFHGYAEMMHMYQALEYDYYLLQEGDTVIVHYNADARPVLTSQVFEKNTKLYNLPYDLPKAIQFQGYYIETVLTDYNFAKAYTYFNNSGTKRTPALDAYFKSRYVDLDSLSAEYDKYKDSLKQSIDTLRSSGNIDKRYCDYYVHRFFPENRYNTMDVVQSDSLLHYISNYVIAQEYCGGRNTLDSFDFIEKDTIVTSMARNGILKRLINRIMDGEGGWHVYSDKTVSLYLQKYINITGDLMPEQNVEKKGIVVDESSYGLPLETVDGQRTSLEEVLGRYKGSLVYLDFWASWCAPCLAQIPYTKALQKRFSGDEICFLFVSTDINRKNWGEKVQEYSDVFDGSYRILDPEATFLKEIRLSSIPRNLIFDREGHLLDPDAIRPSDESIDNRLKSLLNETKVNKQKP